MATVLNLKARGSKASQYPSLEFWADLTRGEDTLSSLAKVLILTQECYGLGEIKEAEEEYDQDKVLHGFAGETEFDEPYEPSRLGLLKITGTTNISSLMRTTTSWIQRRQRSGMIS